MNQEPENEQNKIKTYNGGGGKKSRSDGHVKRWPPDVSDLLGISCSSRRGWLFIGISGCPLLRN